MGYTMRFPRALGIREDLSIADCMPASGMCSTPEKGISNDCRFSRF